MKIERRIFCLAAPVVVGVEAWRGVSEMIGQQLQAA
jgi:hypothetical protein